VSSTQSASPNGPASKSGVSDKSLAPGGGETFAGMEGAVFGGVFLTKLEAIRE
jgi:hypothetical protein